jgi:hypothetical protein
MKQIGKSEKKCMILKQNCAQNDIQRWVKRKVHDT